MFGASCGCIRGALLWFFSAAPLARAQTAGDFYKGRQLIMIVFGGTGFGL